MGKLEKNILNPIKSFYLKWRVDKDEDFLIEQGIKKANKQRLEINFGTEYRFTLEDKKGRIYLPPSENGIDVRELVALVADDYPKITKRYISNKEKLSR